MADKVLFVLPSFGFGGAERVAADILAYLRGRGMDVAAVALPRPNANGSSSEEAWFRPVCETSKIPRSDRLPAQLEALVDEFDPSILVLCGRSPAYEALPTLRARRPWLRIVGFQFNARQLREEHRIYAPYIDAIVAESFDVAAALTAGGAVQVPVVVVSSGVPVAELSARARPAPRDVPTVGYVGRFDRSKNPGGFVRMVRLLRQRPYRFVMAGAAPAHFRPPRPIEFHGLLLGETLQQLIDGIDILVVPSRNDGRPLIIQEAQARGIAVVASRVGGIPELVEHDVTGLLCPIGDVAAFAAAVDRLAADPQLRRRLGHAGRARVQAEGDVAAALPRYAEAIIGPCAARLAAA